MSSMDPKPVDAPRVVWHQQTVSFEDRIRRNGHRAGVIWFTGLSGSGKSTVANVLDQLLFEQKARSYLLDGDNVRHTLCATPAMLEQSHSESFAKRFGLGFGAEDREENIRRVGAATGLLVSAGLIVLTAFVSPYRADRGRVRAAIEKISGPGSFVEVYVDTPIEVCETRDPKGLYKQAREGKIANFTGVSDPYEAPLHCELTLKASVKDPTSLAKEVLEYLQDRRWFA